ncbi:hypothetical protein II906_07875 [bacterium]|nr:hypothetical protein [bacterium]
MRKDVHLRINNELYSKISDLSTLHKTTINDEIASLLELSFKINDNDKRITERQKICLRNLIYENETYKSLAATLCVSESTIKKDMTDLYGIFNVKSKNELKKQLLGMDNNIKKLLFNEKDGEIV